MPEVRLIDAPRGVFKFQVAGDATVWSLPLMGSLPVAVARRMTGGRDDNERLENAFDVVGELCPGLLDKVTVAEFNEVLTAWTEASGVTPGESRGSSS